MKLVKYVGNATSHDQTGAISFNSKDRPDIQMGGMGEMTDEEIAALAPMGIVLEVVDDGGLSGMTVKDLDKRAEKLGVELDEGASKDEKVSALRAHLASNPSSQVPGEEGQAAVGGTTVGASGGPTGTSTGGGPAT